MRLIKSPLKLPDSECISVIIQEFIFINIWSLINVSNPTGKTLPIMQTFVLRHSETE
jgi:hypothetical protein